MPINKKKMSNLKKEYGEKKGESIYYALENKDKSKKKTSSKKKKQYYIANDIKNTKRIAQYT